MWAFRLFACALMASPAAGRAEPIIVQDDSVSPVVRGWSNSLGEFAIDFGSANAIAGASESIGYSVASGAYAMRSPFIFVGGNGAFADTRIDATIRNDGTVTGNLAQGALSIIAGQDGISPLGIPAGQTLVVGRMIDSAAVQGAYDTFFLFEVIFRNAALPDFGSYLTYLNPHTDTWGNDRNPNQPFGPFGYDVAQTSGGFTFWDLLPTRKVPEPEGYLLALLALAAMTFSARRARLNRAADRGAP
jgi:hypothetical protein